MTAASTLCHAAEVCQECEEDICDTHRDVHASSSEPQAGRDPVHLDAAATTLPRSVHHNSAPQCIIPQRRLSAAQQRLMERG